MAEEKIVVTISPEGVLKIEAHGYVGKRCLKETGELEALLGSALERELKACYFHSEKKQVTKFLNICG